MSRRSRENLGLYRRRTTQNPTYTVERGPNTPTSGGGGNKWVDWETLPLDPNDNYWTLYKHANAGSMTAGIVDGKLKMNTPAIGANVQFASTSPKGMALISSQPVNLYLNSGVPDEAVSNHDWLQESTTLKIEAQLEPITGVAANGYGSSLQLMAGFVVYLSDQNGNPGQPQYWCGGRVWKNNTANPAISSNNNQYKVGYVHRSGQSDASASWRWKGTPGDSSTSSDSVVCEMMSGLRRQLVVQASTFRGGVYRSDASEFINSRFFSPAHHVSCDAFTGNRWVHAFIGFGCRNGIIPTVQGWANITRIRLAVQPLASRANFPGA